MSNGFYGELINIEVVPSHGGSYPVLYFMIVSATKSHRRVRFRLNKYSYAKLAEAILTGSAKGILVSFDTDTNGIVTTDGLIIKTEK